MSRFYFNIRNDIHTDDDEGGEFPDLEAARDHALESARDLVCADIKRGWLNLDHYIEILDENRRPALRLTFRDAFTVYESETDRRASG